MQQPTVMSLKLTHKMLNANKLELKKAHTHTHMYAHYMRISNDHDQMELVNKNKDHFYLPEM